MDKSFFSAFAIIALFGFLFTLGLHLLTFLPLDLEAIRPIYFVSFIGIFIVWLPTILTMIAGQRKGSRPNLIQAISFAPLGLKILIPVLISYVFFNFFYTGLVLNKGGGPNRIGDKEVLSNRGEILKELTPQQYQQAVSNELRMISGHPLVFYGVAFVILFSKKRELELQK